MKTTGKFGVMLLVLMFCVLVAGCGESTATTRPAPTATLVPVASPTNQATVAITSDGKTSPPVTDLATSNGSLPLFTSSKELVDYLKVRPEVLELPLDPAFLEATRSYFDKDPELVVKLLVYSGEFDANLGFDPQNFKTFARAYNTAELNPGNAVTGNIFGVVERSDQNGQATGNYPQLAFHVSSLKSPDVQKLIDDLNRFSQNHLDSQKFLAQVQGKDYLSLVIVGRNLVESIQSKRIPTAVPVTPVPVQATTPTVKPVANMTAEDFYNQVKDINNSFKFNSIRSETTGHVVDPDGKAVDFSWMVVALLDKNKGSTGLGNISAFSVEDREGSAIKKGLYLDNVYYNYDAENGWRITSASSGQGWFYLVLPGCLPVYLYQMIVSSASPTTVKFLTDEQLDGRSVGVLSVETPRSDTATVKLVYRFEKSSLLPLKVRIDSEASNGQKSWWEWQAVEYNNPNLKVELPVEAVKLPTPTSIPMTTTAPKK